MTVSRHGRCLCGRIGFEWTGEPNWVAYCHCQSCRRNTASPVTAFFGVPTDALRWTGDTPEAFASSPGVKRSFCARCGTPVAFEADAFPGEIHLYVAALDDPDSLEPQGHVHTGEQLAWFEILDDLPRYETTTESGKPPGHGPRKT